MNLVITRTQNQKPKCEGETTMKYGFSTKVDNRGRAFIGAVISVSDDAVSTFKSTPSFDLYFDVFDTLLEAQQVRKSTVEENKA